MGQGRRENGTYYHGFSRMTFFSWTTARVFMPRKRDRKVPTLSNARHVGDNGGFADRLVPDHSEGEVCGAGGQTQYDGATIEVDITRKRLSPTSWEKSRATSYEYTARVLLEHEPWEDDRDRENYRMSGAKALDRAVESDEFAARWV